MNTRAYSMRMSTKDLSARIARTLIKISVAPGPPGVEDSAGLSINTPLRAVLATGFRYAGRADDYGAWIAALEDGIGLELSARRRGFPSNRGHRSPRSSGQAEMALPVRTDASNPNSQGTPRGPSVSGETAHQTSDPQSLFGSATSEV